MGKREVSEHSQIEKFKKAAREAECDEGSEALDRAFRRLNVEKSDARPKDKPPKKD